jgi:hypothetical protein
MYSPSTPFNEYLEVEQAKYPELKLDDIEKLKESLADDQTLPPISGQVTSGLRGSNRCKRYTFLIMFTGQ